MTNYQEGFHPYGGYGKRPTSEGGGGGGAQIKFVNVSLGTDTTPVVGKNASDTVTYPLAMAMSMVVDGTEILNTDEGSTFVRFISGSTVKQPIFGYTLSSAHIVTIKDEGRVPRYSSVTTWSTDNYSIANGYLEYTVPNLAEDEHLVFVMTEAKG